MVGRSDVWVQLEAMPVVGMGARRLRYPLKRALFVIQAGSRRAWEERIALVKRCPDDAAIPRVPTAGLAQGGAIVMHNGIRVLEPRIPASLIGQVASNLSRWGELYRSALFSELRPRMSA